MSTSLRSAFLGATVFLTLGCAPAFPPADARACGLQPVPVECEGCTVFSAAPAMQSRQLPSLDGGFSFVGREGWREGGPLFVGGFSVLADATDDEVLVWGPRRVSATSVDLRTGAVRVLGTPSSVPLAWVRSPRGFWVLSEAMVAPSSPKVAPRALATPARQVLTASRSERPLDLLSSGAALVPTSNGLFAFDPSRPEPFSLLARGAFTSATRLGTDVYALRCEVKTVSNGIEEGALLPGDAACELVRFVETERDATITLARFSGAVELAPFRDRVVVRTWGELFEVSRTGAVRLLYSVPLETNSAGAELPTLGALEVDGDRLVVRQAGCLVTLDETHGTSIGPASDGRTLERSGRFFRLGAPATTE